MSVEGSGYNRKMTKISYSTKLGAQRDPNSAALHLISALHRVPSGFRCTNTLFCFLLSSLHVLLSILSFSLYPFFRHVSPAETGIEPANAHRIANAGLRIIAKFTAPTAKQSELDARLHGFIGAPPSKRG